MQVKKGVATATMTDVKNLIGDVFELVDKHGEVRISSYGKERYLISKITATQKPEKSEAKTLQTPEQITQPKQKVAQTTAKASFFNLLPDLEITWQRDMQSEQDWVQTARESL